MFGASFPQGIEEKTYLIHGERGVSLKEGILIYYQTDKISTNVMRMEL
jgi:hypothetical protein